MDANKALTEPFLMGALEPYHMESFVMLRECWGPVKGVP